MPVQQNADFTCKSRFLVSKLSTEQAVLPKVVDK